MKPLFFLGNRRSGTTMMCHLLNRHPNVYVAFERYIMWMLRHIYLTGRADAFYAPPQGVPYPMWITLGVTYKEFGLADRDTTLEGLRKSFYSIVTKWIGTRHDGNKDLIWVGEKNPPEYSWPTVFNFIMKVHPDAKFMHVVRHPRNCVGSKFKCNKHWDLEHPIWNKPIPELFSDWLQHEQWVCDIKASRPGIVLTVRYEDLCLDPKGCLKVVQEFLELGTPFVKTEFVDSSRDLEYDLDVPGEVQEFMRVYGYE